MLPIDRPDATRRAGASAAGYLAIVDLTHEGDINIMESLWQPEPEEIAAIAAGQPVILAIVGNFHPVVSLGVLAETAEVAEG